LIQILAWIFVALVLGAVVGAVYQKLGTRRDGKVYPAPGRLIDIGTHRLHLLESGCAGSGPTILLEAGLMSTVLSWSELQRELARSFHVVSYDRAGLGWSDLGPMPRTAERIVNELHTLLQKAGVPPPYVLVGHSFGGLTMPLFAARFPEEVAGVVLVDSVAPAEWNPPPERDLKLTRIGAKVCRRAALLARIGVIRFVAYLLTTPLKKAAALLVRLISRGTPDDSGSVSSPWFAALPDNERAMASVFWVQEKFALTIASQLENLPVSAAQTGQFAVFCDKKVIILSAGTSSERRVKEHAAIVARLPFGEHVLARQSNHWIMQQELDTVLGAVNRVVEHWEKSAVVPAGNVFNSDHEHAV
jgi:pimeloyl-ACP methyl ester carboxylesterase